MMKRRRVIVLGSLLGCGLAIAGVLALRWWTAPERRINAETFTKITEGMTEAEVVELIGLPPGDYSTGPLMAADMDPADAPPMFAAQPEQWAIFWLEGRRRMTEERSEPPGSLSREWTCDRGVIGIRFTLDGARILSKEYLPACTVPQSPLDRLRRWLRL